WRQVDSNFQFRDALSGGQGYPEGFRQPGAPLGGDRQRAGVAQAGDPAQLEAPPGQRRADRTRQMRAAFAPVEAGSAESPFPVTVLMQLDAEIGKESLTRRGHYPAVLTKQHISALDERIGQRHAEPPG